MATCRKHGVSQVTVYRWRGKYGGMSRSELIRMKELERENLQLRKIVVLEEVSKGKWQAPKAREPQSGMRRFGAFAASVSPAGLWEPGARRPAASRPRPPKRRL